MELVKHKRCIECMGMVQHAPGCSKYGQEGGFDFEFESQVVSSDEIAGPVIRDRSKSSPDGCLVGSAVKRIIQEDYHTSPGGCECQAKADQMDMMGCEGCLESFDEIVGWLCDGAAEKYWILPTIKKIPFVGGMVENEVKERASEILTRAINQERMRVAREQLEETNEMPKQGQHKVIPWAYGITTVKSRLTTTLPITLASLEKAGFDKPVIGMDGVGYREDLGDLERYEHIRRPTTIRTFGNFILTLWEVYIRNPLAMRYAMFQDDFVTYRNLKSYLTNCEFPKNGYFNLYTFPANQDICDKEGGEIGWYRSNQKGLGAVALVFDRDTVMSLLSSKKAIVERPTCPNRRSYSNIDGGIVTSLKQYDIAEYVHNPSLVQHIGDESSMGGRKHPKATSFRGEDFDARELLK